MQRRVIDTCASVINVINSVSSNEMVPVDEIASRAGIDQREVRDAIEVMYFIQKSGFAPSLVSFPVEGAVKKERESGEISLLGYRENVLMIMFKARAFDDASMVPASVGKGLQVKDGDFQSMIDDELVIVSSDGKSMHLSKKGKFQSQGVLAGINKKMGEWIEGNVMQP